MSQRNVALVLIVLFSTRLICGFQGDPVMYLPSLEIRQPNSFPRTSQYVRSLPQDQLLHANPRLHDSQPTKQEKLNMQNYSHNEIAEALNEINQREEAIGQPRAGGREPASFVQFSHPFGFTPASYGPSPPYHASTATDQTTNTQPKLSLFKPDLSDLLQPVTAKVSNKMNGLVALIFSLLTGSAQGGLELTGIKDLVIDGILRPLLIAKGGIKSLISKLSIPVVSLLLINLEVLVTVWWLWEECPAQVVPVSSANPANNNSYS